MLINSQAVVIQASSSSGINHQRPLFFHVSSGGTTPRFQQSNLLLVNSIRGRNLVNSNSNKHFYNYNYNNNNNNNIKAAAAVEAADLLSTGGEGETDGHLEVTALVRVRLPVSMGIGQGLGRGLELVADHLGKPVLLELIGAHFDSKTGLEKVKITGYAHKKKHEGLEVQYEANFTIPADFGAIGAVRVENEHHNEMFFEDIVLAGFPTGSVHFTCNSWVHSVHHNKHKRIFFSDKSYLPSETPEGLVRLREEALLTLRGNGQGERKKGDRVYDYDVYNDLGNPDEPGGELARPVLGGKENPYPRRIRTGRPRCKKDRMSETRGSYFYVPRNEEFAELKQATFSVNTVYSVLHALVPQLSSAIVNHDHGFPYFSAIDNLFNEGIHVPPHAHGFWRDLLPNLFKAVTDSTRDVLRFKTPHTIERDRFFWFNDQEFSRQALAGLNPCCIKLVTEWPLRSELDPAIYGPPESAITTEIVEERIKGFCGTVKEAVKQKKLFLLDYHDLLLPFVSQIRKLEDRSFYGSRTLFFLTPDDTLMPLAIELTRPPIDGKPQWKEVFRPHWHSSGIWLWRLAKAHVLSHDSGYHQLISHWLRTHCCTEPYIIAARRQLSAMHPIFRLLHPHFRYTMEINALARQALINADGIIETCFSPGKYSLQFSSFIYDKVWRFDNEALPKDLINRGLAVEDPSAPHGLKLTIEDYPYANDGLVLWDAIKEWISAYVNHYYPDPNVVVSDTEIQAWWSEVRNVGHGDKKDEPWWPDLKTPEDLIGIITTIVWVTSGHHAAVNFGQYTYAGYFPNRPTIARTKMPVEDPTEEGMKLFHTRPEAVLLSTFPTQNQATKVMAVLDVLSTHSPDEEYLGQELEEAWAEVPAIKAAFEKFSGKLKELEGIIDERNADENLRNRNGAGIVPYELLKPTSKPGVTGKGVPNSISI